MDTLAWEDASASQEVKTFFSPSQFLTRTGSQNEFKRLFLLTTNEW